MNFTASTIPDVVLIEPKVFGDARGFFMETWNAREFAKNGLDASFVQDNQSRSARGVLRGLHYQIQQPQGKLVRVVAGEIFDVAVDLRKSSQTFGRWVGFNLSSENKKEMWVPPGFAHGFLVISEYADVEYKCTEFYAPQYERSLAWNDTQLAIAWPLTNDLTPLLAQKDAQALRFRDAEYYP